MIFQCGLQVEARGARRRRKAEKYGGCQCQSNRKPQHAKIWASHKTEHPLVRRNRGRDGVQAPTRQRDARGASGNSDEKTFGKKLTNQPGASRAHGQAHGNFALARFAARRQQASEVRARNQQDQPNHGRQNAQRLFRTFLPNQPSVPAADQQQRLRDEQLQILPRELEQLCVRFQHRLVNRLQLCLGLSECCSRLEPTHDWQPVIGAIFELLIRVRRHLLPHGDGDENVRR